MITILILIVLLLLCYYYVRIKYSYWKRIGIPYIEPEFPFGNFKTMHKTECSAFMFQRFYRETKAKGPIAGLWIFLSPAVLINDLDIIKKILIKDFNYFTDRAIYHNEKDDILSLNMFAISGPKWRKYRTLLTPTFTSGKMKYMFPTVTKLANDFTRHIGNQIDTENVLEMKDLFSRLTLDVISLVAFGLNMNSIEFPNSELRTTLIKFIATPKLEGFVRLLTTQFPDLSRKLHIKLFHDDVISFFTELIKNVVEYREQNDVFCKDFLQMLIQLKNKGQLDDQKAINYKDSNLSLDELIAQSFLFLAAGFETSSTTLSFMYMELSQNVDVQERGREEVLRILDKYDGEYTYEALGEMKYLDQIIKETLRLYPPVPHIQRRADADYKETTTGITIKKGTLVFMPSFAIQRDPDYYPNPLEFDPDRFSAEEMKHCNPLTFLAFGDGPRNCIGLRFGMMQVKICLAMLLTNFKFTLNSKTIFPIEYMSKPISLRSAGGLWVNVEKISS